MRKHLSFALGLAMLVGMLASVVASAEKVAYVKVPFSFMVKDKEMPAGRYEIRVEGEGSGRLVMRDTGASGMISLLPVMTRLAELGGTMVEVVFDTADGKNYLSEIHWPGGDGFALAGAPGKHTHTTLTTSD